MSGPVTSTVTTSSGLIQVRTLTDAQVLEAKTLELRVLVGLGVTPALIGNAAYYSDAVGIWRRLELSLAGYDTLTAQFGTTLAVAIRAAAVTGLVLVRQQLTGAAYLMKVVTP